MATKLKPKEWPAGHGPNDFQCFGPVAVKDAQFENTMMADLGYFGQDEKDSNKYYHGAVVQSKKNQTWFAYFEYGRQGAENPAFQFCVCNSKQEAVSEYIDQMHSKNDKRGMWQDHPQLGRIIVPKPGKDCYAVRVMASREVGLPDAKSITMNEGAKVVKASPKATASKEPVADPMTIRLMNDLNVGTVQYSRAAMAAGAALPSQAALDFGRVILTEAQKRVARVGNDVKAQLADRELGLLTNQLYSRIPKAKPRNAAPETWLLSANNIFAWLQDIDAFEAALYATDLGSNAVDPFGGMKIKMRYLDRKDPHGEFIHSWFPKMSRLRHGYRGIKILNVWHIERDGDTERLEISQRKVAASNFRITEKPLHQPLNRFDLSDSEKKLYIQSNTAMMIHGSRSCNLTGIMRTSWRLPSELVGVKITAALLGGGIYVADDWGKSVGYTSYRGARYAQGDGSIAGRGSFMFVTDTILGASYIAPAGYGYTCPPKGHHSVFGKMGHTQLGNGRALENNEFVVYDTNQIKARYLIEFDI